MKILLVIQRNCVYSQKAYEHLKKFNFEIKLIYSQKRFEPFPEEISNWEGDYLFSLFNYIIFPKNFLQKVRFPINFHPSTPNHAGSGMINWALYNNDEFFGSTAHLISEDIDNGKILKVKRFKIKNNDSIESLGIKTKEICLKLFYEITEELFIKKKSIAKMLQESSEIKWLCKARKMREVDSMSIINVNITSEELKKRLKAFHTSQYPLRINLHGENFRHE